MLLAEAMYTPESVSAADFRISISPNKWGRGGWDIDCLDSSGEVVGAVTIARPLGMGPCLDAYEVTSSATQYDGLGPLLYDVAMEMSGDAGIMSDRRTVSQLARNVWHHYMSKRSDVSHTQLDSKPGTLTPDIEEDDCNQNSANRYEKWQNSALSKVYRKRGTPTIDRLRELGIIEIVG
jgi:hypothetical protein